MLVFIAEDDAAMRALLALSLKKKGFSVDTAEDGQDLINKLSLARQQKVLPNLIISDVQMPNATGLDVLLWMNQWLPTVPTILISAFGDRQFHIRAQMLGAAAVFDKPLRFRALFERINEILHRHVSDGSPLS